jgi:hypothetical protein
MKFAVNTYKQYMIEKNQQRRNEIFNNDLCGIIMRGMKEKMYRDINDGDSNEHCEWSRSHIQIVAQK